MVDLTRWGKSTSENLSSASESFSLVKIPFGQNLKTLWILLLANLSLIGLLGLVLIMMSQELAHFFLALAMSLCAGAVVMVTGYICYRLMQLKEQQEFVQAGVDRLPIGVLMTTNGQIVFANNQMLRHFGDISQDFLQTFTKEFVAQDSAPASSKLFAAAHQGLTCCEKVIITSHVLPANPWLIEVIPLAGGIQSMLWVFHPSAQSSGIQGFEYLKSHENFRNLFEMSPMGIVLVDPKGSIVSTNRFFREEILNGSPTQSHPQFIDLLTADSQALVTKVIDQLLTGHTLSMPIEITFAGHKNRTISMYASRIHDQEVAAIKQKKISGLILNFFDNSEQKKLNLQLVQAQKMQAMGQLAGGIAHDFNNLLTAMIGFCDLLMTRHSSGDDSFTDIMQIKQNANRAAELVRQLLAFSKQQTLQPQVLNISEILTDLDPMLKRLTKVKVKSSIEVEIINAPDLDLIKIDRGQFEQMIINFLVNARDAMDEAGIVYIKTHNQHYESATHVNHEIIPAGDYVVVDIIDSGCGIPRENVSRIFDPFFSTKAIGKGTGLGLSMAYGVIKQTGGYILVDSEEGKGTKFSLVFPQYLPQDKRETAQTMQGKARTVFGDLTGHGTILFVEDEAPVRLFGVRALRDKGYTVIEADCGNMALDVVRQYLEHSNDPIDLMITDVVMPEMDGQTLVKQVHELCPGLKVIYISGYAEDLFIEKDDKDSQLFFLPKPFSLKQLAAKVKYALKKEEAEDPTEVDDSGLPTKVLNPITLDETYVP